MISEKMQAALNKQINEEWYSAYLYLSMSAYGEKMDLPGFANWFYVQYQEEVAHVMKFYHYIIEQNGAVQLLAIEEPPHEFGQPLDLFTAALQHEQHITNCIGRLMDLAQEERDHATQIFLQWFITEQIEEEANASALIAQLKRADDKNGLLLIDRELQQRVFTPPVAN